MTIHELAHNLYLVPIPIPVPLKVVNAYALKGSNGWTLVDTGFHDDGAEAAWRSAFATLGFGPGDVEQILVTHMHPDHYGAAGWLQEWTGAPVLMHAPEVPLTKKVWDPAYQLGSLVEAFFRRHGLPADRAEMAGNHQGTKAVQVSPAPQLTSIPTDAVIPLGDRHFRVIWTPGHSDGLAVFLSEDDGILLVNDMVLPKITPNVPLWPGSNPDPLGSFLDSLRRVAMLPVRRTFPGHRTEIADLAARCSEIAAHHDVRLSAILDMIGDRSLTAWEVSQALFGDEPDHHHTRFALAETLSHVEYLTLRDYLCRQEDEHTVRYFRKPA